jgi:hypothetical protein
MMTNDYILRSFNGMRMGESPSRIAGITPEMVAYAKEYGEGITQSIADGLVDSKDTPEFCDCGPCEVHRLLSSDEFAESLRKSGIEVL